MSKRLPLVLALALSLALFLAGTAGAEIRVGTGVRVITPEPLLPVSGGMGPTAPADEKRGELTARAAVFERGDLRVAVVSVDLLGFPSVLGDRARKQIRGVPPENVLIAATHTHSAPDCYGFPDGQGGHTGNLAYMYTVCRKIAEAVNEAVGSLRPAHLRVATGKVEGKIAYNAYAPELYDRRAGVLQAVGPEGEPIVTLVNYAVHPEVLGADVGIVSPDLVGPMCERIESSAGGMAMFVNGAQGGMVTADNRDFDRPRESHPGHFEDVQTWDECLRIGRALADESLRILDGAPVDEDPGLFCGAVAVEFPIESDEMWVVVRHSPLNYPTGDDRRITTRVNVVNLGSAQILTVPGEALPNIGFYLKRKMRGEHNFLFGLTNDAFGYILTKVDFGSFDRYEYISRVSLGEMTGEIFMQKALDFVDKCPPPD